MVENLLKGLPVRKVLRMRILHEPGHHRDHSEGQRQSYDAQVYRCPDGRLLWRKLVAD